MDWAVLIGVLLISGVLGVLEDLRRRVARLERRLNGEQPREVRTTAPPTEPAPAQAKTDTRKWAEEQLAELRKSKGEKP